MQVQAKGPNLYEKPLHGYDFEILGATKGYLTQEELAKKEQIEAAIEVFKKLKETMRGDEWYTDEKTSTLYQPSFWNLTGSFDPAIIEKHFQTMKPLLSQDIDYMRLYDDALLGLSKISKYYKKKELGGKIKAFINIYKIPEYNGMSVATALINFKKLSDKKESSEFLKTKDLERTFDKILKMRENSNFTSPSEIKEIDSQFPLALEGIKTLIELEKKKKKNRDRVKAIEGIALTYKLKIDEVKKLHTPSEPSRDEIRTSGSSAEVVGMEPPPKIPPPPTIKNQLIPYKDRKKESKLEPKEVVKIEEKPVEVEKSKKGFNLLKIGKGTPFAGLSEEDQKKALTGKLKPVERTNPTEFKSNQMVSVGKPSEIRKNEEQKRQSVKTKSPITKIKKVFKAIKEFKPLDPQDLNKTLLSNHDLMQALISSDLLNKFPSKPTYEDNDAWSDEKLQITQEA